MFPTRWVQSWAANANDDLLRELIAIWRELSPKNRLTCSAWFLHHRPRLRAESAAERLFSARSNTCSGHMTKR